MNSLVLLPEGKISWSKLSQALDYGAVICQLNTDFDGCVRVLAEVVRRAPVYLLNSVNPYRLEGQKTAALEIAEEFDWQVPDHVIVPGGNLANSSALGKGFLEMMHLGLTSKVPKITVVQAEGANPLYLSLLQSGRTRNPAGAGQHPGHRHSDRKPGFLAQGSARHPANRRLLRAGQRSRDRSGKGRDWPGGYRLRAGIRRNPGRPEKAAFARARSTATNRSCSCSPATRSRIPSTSSSSIREKLLSKEESAGQEREIAEKRRATLSLEASADAVLRVLEAAIQA